MESDEKKEYEDKMKMRAEEKNIKEEVRTQIELEKALNSKNEEDVESEEKPELMPIKHKVHKYKKKTQEQLDFEKFFIYLIMRYMKDKPVESWTGDEKQVF